MRPGHGHVGILAGAVVLLALMPASRAPNQAGPAAAAGSRRPMTLLDLIAVPRITDVQLSPDGGSVIYTLGRNDWKADG